jgi:hypothetical protein
VYECEQTPAKEAQVKHDMAFLTMAPAFGAVGALATAAVWQLFAVSLINFVPEQLTVLSCLAAGVAGPLVVWGILLTATRGRSTGMSGALRRAASVGLGLVVAAELGFYIPLGFLAIAFH